jgi:hypothetical protein
LLIVFRCKLLGEVDAILIFELELIVVHIDHLECLSDQEVDVLQLEKHPSAEIRNPLREASHPLFVSCFEDDFEPFSQEEAGKLGN